MVLNLRQVQVATRTAVMSNSVSIRRPIVKVAVGMHTLSTGGTADCRDTEAVEKVRSFSATTRKPRTIAIVFFGGGGGGGMKGRATSRRLLD